MKETEKVKYLTRDGRSWGDVTLQEARAMVREGKEAEAILKAVDAVDALNAGKK